ncbi:S16 family serine protease [Saccharococcus sp. Marseille-Q5394]|uniref:S16 family serine protease n=1 Tax=Saccharococcus sp. Marseille-Q5394 TaxID=2972778 RepID=UPI0021C7C336|nr:S16 family serine protease [Saccharococcus sp. Marseille-Q5394]
MIIAAIALIIFRKDKLKSLIAFLVIVVLSLFFGYESLLLDYESNTYIAEVYREPEEIIQNSGIYILAIGLSDIHYVDEEKMVRDIYERDGIQLFDLYKIKNRDRYNSKSKEIIHFLGFGKEQFHVMGENVKGFIREDIKVINDFLNRDNLRGDSAGLALGLSAMVHQSSLHNRIPLGVTGTLEPNGDVNQVGGIAGKMMISEQNGFPYIIVPYANREEAETVKARENLAIEILPVHHIDEAVMAIKELNDQ